MFPFLLGFSSRHSLQVVVPFFYGKGVCIRPCIFFKRIEFGTFKIGIMQTFPLTQKFDYIATSKPAMYCDSRIHTPIV